MDSGDTAYTEFDFEDQVISYIYYIYDLFLDDFLDYVYCAIQFVWAEWLISEL